MTNHRRWFIGPKSLVLIATIGILSCGRANNADTSGGLFPIVAQLTQVDLSDTEAVTKLLGLPIDPKVSYVKGTSQPDFTRYAYKADWKPGIMVYYVINDPAGKSIHIQLLLNSLAQVNFGLSKAITCITREQMEAYFGKGQDVSARFSADERRFLYWPIRGLARDPVMINGFYDNGIIQGCIRWITVQFVVSHGSSGG
jgi:hypothetical protein